jgi:hypothetical protein
MLVWQRQRGRTRVAFARHAPGGKIGSESIFPRPQGK